MIYILLLIIFNNIISESSKISNGNVKTIYNDISQGMSLYTNYFKQKNRENKFQCDINVTYRFEKNNNKNTIAEVLFNSKNNHLLFQGNNFNNDIRDNNAIIAEYFGFGSDTDFNIDLNPHIINSIINLQINTYSKRFWISSNIPFVYSKRTIIDRCEKLNGKIGQEKLQDFSIASFFSPPNQSDGWKRTDIPVVQKNNYKVGRAVDTAGNNFLVEFDGPIVDNVTGNFDSSQGFSDLVNYLIEDTSIEIIDSADTTSSISASCANLDTDFNVDLNDKEDNYPFLNEEVGFGSFQSSYINSIQGNYTKVTNSVGEGNVFIESTINGIELTNKWKNILDDYSMELEIIQPQVNCANSLKEALSGELSLGDMKKREYNNFYFNENNKVYKDEHGISDLSFHLGYNLFINEKNRLGLYIKTVLPTGTKIDKDYNKYIFSPIIGNGGHCELGGGVNAEITIKENDATKVYCNIDGYITHGFEAKNFRISEEENKPMSRYATLKKMIYDSSIIDIFDGDIYGYQKILKTLGDVCSDYINISIPLLGEFVVDVGIKKNNWGLGLGYNFLGKSDEKSDCLCKNKNELLSKKDGEIFYGYHMLSCLTSLCFVPTVENQAENTIGTFYPPNSTNIGTYIQAKTNGMVVENRNGSAYVYGKSIQATDNDVFQPFMNNTCLSNGILVHKFFIHGEYYFSEYIGDPHIKIFGSFGISDKKKQYEISRWDIGCGIGFIF